MLSTAWSRTDPFWTAWASDDQTWIRLKATADTDPALFDAEFLALERRALGEDGFKREYLGIPVGAGASPFTWDLYDRATQIRVPLVPPGPAFGPPAAAAAGTHPQPLPKAQTNRSTSMIFNRDDPNTWPCFRPPIIAHDVGRSRDRSTAVIGGNSPFQPRLLGIKELEELRQGLYGSARASELATIDRRYNSNALIVADLSNDPTYAEVLFETFGPRVIGLHISRSGDGMKS